jgi:hypothetical protein
VHPDWPAPKLVLAEVIQMGIKIIPGELALMMASAQTTPAHNTFVGVKLTEAKDRRMANR